MQLKQYQVDAFAAHVFTGNPAAICPLATWLDDALLQAIAQENNLSETAFFVPSPKGFHLRWFTPVAEVDLCGHATLASAHVIFSILGYARNPIVFETRSGDLIVEKVDEQLQMNFPALAAERCDIDERFINALGRKPKELWAGSDYLAVFDDEEIIRTLQPDQTLLSQLDLRGVIVTAPGSEFDFVSRFFAPKFGIPEDPVTGSAHCLLAPYWAKRFGKNNLRARQISKRGGNVHCRLEEDRVYLTGSAVLFSSAEIAVAIKPLHSLV